MDNGHTKGWCWCKFDYNLGFIGIPKNGSTSIKYCFEIASLVPHVINVFPGTQRYDIRAKDLYFLL